MNCCICGDPKTLEMCDKCWLEAVHDDAWRDNDDFDHAARNAVKLSNFEATMICEGNWERAGHEPSEELALQAWQQLVDTGLAWSLRGAFGRAASLLIEAGLIEASIDMPDRVKLSNWGHGGQTV